jgi:hypothetical protein
MKCSFPDRRFPMQRSEFSKFPAHLAALGVALVGGALSVWGVAVAQDAGSGAAVGTEVDDWSKSVEALGHAEFARREEAYTALRNAGSAARKALEAGAASKDAQVRWSSRRLLRLLEEDGADVDGDGGAQEKARRVLRFNGEVPEPDSEEPAKEQEGAESTIEDAIRDLEERMRSMERGFRWADTPPMRSEKGFQQREVIQESREGRTHLSIDAEGKVKVVLRRNVEGGEPVEEVFEAPSMEALEREHADVHARVKDLAGAGGVFRFEWPEMPRFQRGFDVDPFEFWRRDGQEEGSSRQAKKALGVIVSPVPDLLRSHLDLPAESGLVVDEVIAGTTAERLGLRRHDLLLSLNGVPISRADEVRSALDAVATGGDLELSILRRGKTEVLRGVR